MDMKDIMIKIVGKQYEDDDPKERMEFVTEGKMSREDGAFNLEYDESDFSGYPGCKTSLLIDGDYVRMKRVGEDMQDGTVMEFQTGKRFTSKYDTPYGAVDMEILTDKVLNELKESGLGSVDIDYHVSLDGGLEGRNELRIEVSEGTVAEEEKNA